MTTTQGVHEMGTFQEGLQLLWSGKHAEALSIFEECLVLEECQSDPDLLFNLGLCHYKCGNLSQAREVLEKVVTINGADLDAQKILRKITIQVPPLTPSIPQPTDSTPAPSPPAVMENYKLPDFRKDGAIIDANFLINFWNYDSPHFIRFIRKTRKRYNLYTSCRVYREIMPIGCESIDAHSQVQNFLTNSLIQETVPSPVLKTLEERVLREMADGVELRDSHVDRPYAWKNDLSLVCLLLIVKNPVKYIVTNDMGVQKIVHFLHPEKEKDYYLRPNGLFILSVDQFCRSNSKPFWERRLYCND